MNTRIWDMKEGQKEKTPLLEVLGNIVSAYVSCNRMETHELTPLIQQVFSVLCTLHHNPSGRSTSQPAVDIADSVTEAYLICLEDGKKLKMLKRHLRTSYKMTPEDYRAKWGLPPDYPMVAAGYAAKRSSLAKSNGLGRASRAKEMAAAVAAAQQQQQQQHTTAA